MQRSGEAMKYWKPEAERLREEEKLYEARP